MDALDVLSIVATGPQCSVAMTYRVHREYRTWSPEGRAGLLRIMQILAEYGSSDLNDKQFRYETAFTPRGAHRAEKVYAVKAYTFRIYGCFVGTVSKRFIGTYFDAAKKQSKADRGALQRAADYIVPHLGG